MFEKLVCQSYVRDVLCRCLNALSLQGLVKTIPGTSAGQTPIHEVEKPLYGRMQK